MADWVRTFTSGDYAANWRSRLNYVVASQSGNASYIELRQYIYSTSSVYWIEGGWDGRVYINGNQVNRNTPSARISNGEYLMNAYGQWINHDANGNAVLTVGSYCNSVVNNLNQQNTGGWTLPRIPEAPSINNIVADQIKPTSARIGVEINSHGHGTTSYMRMYYRIQGSGSAWSQTYDQEDANGYNYWIITGLKPGKVYEYYSHNWNNNNDATSSGTATFKTKSVPGMTPVLMGLIN